VNLRRCWDSVTQADLRLDQHVMATFIVAILIFAGTLHSRENSLNSKQLLDKFSKQYEQKSDLVSLKSDVLELGSAAVPTLILVMKDGKYPDKNRWVATFLLGRIMGKSSAPFISKFLDHPNWVMRLASLKTMLAIKADKYGVQYAKSLSDKAMLVRIQALENIRHLKLGSQGKAVWKMMFNRDNYYQPGKSKGSRKRTPIIGKAIRTLGDLDYKTAEVAMLKMVVNQRYDDIFEELDYSLAKITGKKSSGDRVEHRRKYWQNILASR
jgi:hypothetical protein